MAMRNSGKITVTLYRETVSKLRDIKGARTWDDFLLSLAEARIQGARVECIVCRDVLTTEGMYESPSILAEKNGWSEVEVTKIGEKMVIGFVCQKCMEKQRDMLEWNASCGNMLTTEDRYK